MSVTRLRQVSPACRSSASAAGYSHSLVPDLVLASANSSVTNIRIRLSLRRPGGVTYSEISVDPPFLTVPNDTTVPIAPEMPADSVLGAAIRKTEVRMSLFWYQAFPDVIGLGIVVWAFLH